MFQKMFTMITVLALTAAQASAETLYSDKKTSMPTTSGQTAVERIGQLNTSYERPSGVPLFQEPKTKSFKNSVGQIHKREFLSPSGRLLETHLYAYSKNHKTIVRLDAAGGIIDAYRPCTNDVLIVFDHLRKMEGKPKLGPGEKILAADGKTTYIGRTSSLEDVELSKVDEYVRGMRVGIEGKKIKLSETFIPKTPGGFAGTIETDIDLKSGKLYVTKNGEKKEASFAEYGKIAAGALALKKEFVNNPATRAHIEKAYRVLKAHVRRSALS